MAQARTLREGALSVHAVRTVCFEDLAIGMRETILRTVRASDVTAFAQISGDVNPIHLCDAYAAQTFFGQRIAHGLFTASLISAILGTRLPGPGAIYLSQTLDFRAPVRIGDVVAASVEVAQLVDKGARARLACECIVDGKLVLEGEAWVKAPRRL
jgi:3-hydroxybutyryl-CoA dehydratase